jgi:hypothetical protein
MRSPGSRQQTLKQWRRRQMGKARQPFLQTGCAERLDGNAIWCDGPGSIFCMEAAAGDDTHRAASIC